MVLWTEKYKPRKLDQVIGQNKAIEEIIAWFNTWKKGSKALLIAGPTGSGKTVLVYALANEKDYEILEMNASDLRNKANVQEIVANATMQTSLFKKGKIILIDEVDGIAGRKDYGGVGEIVKCIKESNQRIILTANDPWDKKLNELRKNVKIVELNKLSYLSIANFLNEICKKEKLKVDDNVLKKISVSVRGDLRAAINDLDCLSNNRCEIKSLDVDVIGEREKEERIFEVLRLIFKTKDLAACSEAFDRVNLNLDEILLWIEENLPLEYTNPEELSKAYDYLSKFDVFTGRIRRWQHWRFLVYQKAFLSNGVALSKKGNNNGFINYKRSSRILKLWKAKMIFAKRDTVVLKLAKEMHVSKRKALRDFLPYMPFILNDKAVREEFNLDNKDLKILNAVQ